SNLPGDAKIKQPSSPVKHQKDQVGSTFDYLHLYGQDLANRNLLARAKLRLYYVGLQLHIQLYTLNCVRRHIKSKMPNLRQ
ncbi:unnamed protein product, partial [Dovyalis caffra]